MRQVHGNAVDCVTAAERGRGAVPLPPGQVPAADALLTDAPDTVSWSRIGRLYAARDTKHPWFAVWGTPGDPLEGEPDEGVAAALGLT